MGYIHFKQHFEPFRVFSLQDILKWDRAFDTRRLVEWQSKGYLIKVINRWYMFTGEKAPSSSMYLIANRIYAPSYISFQSAWAYYGLIPEGVYQVTSASTLKTHIFKTKVGVFSYRQLKPALMFGYRFIDDGGQQCKMADPEKLILDHLYLNPSLKSAEDFESLRLNQSLLKEIINREKLTDYSKLFGSQALENRMVVFCKTYEL